MAGHLRNSVTVWMQSVKPVTPKATQAPPGAESAPQGVWRVLPAGAFASRFQHLFHGKGVPLLPSRGPLLKHLTCGRLTCTGCMGC